MNDEVRGKFLKIHGIIWLESIVEKLEYKHSVFQLEVIELFSSLPHYRFVEKGHQANENVYAALGRAESGRYLIVFFVLKSNKKALVISARDMTANERKRYEES
jgi:uncharacterized DUF497 family protein